jgi:hypothetical protein
LLSSRLSQLEQSQAGWKRRVTPKDVASGEPRSTTHHAPRISTLKTVSLDKPTTDDESFDDFASSLEANLLPRLTSAPRPRHQKRNHKPTTHKPKTFQSESLLDSAKAGLEAVEDFSKIELKTDSHKETFPDKMLFKIIGNSNSKFVHIRAVKINKDNTFNVTLRQDISYALVLPSQVNHFLKFPKTSFSKIP